MDDEAFRFTAELWEWEGADAWCFVTVPADIGDEIRLLAGPPKGFGSVRVEVTVGDSTWQTSVFPDKTRGYLLPVKRAVRRAEELEVGESIEVSLVVIGG
jgi:hypothetical protein